MATLWSLNEPPKVPSESHKIRGFRVAFEDDDQLASSYRLLVGGALGDILSDIDYRLFRQNTYLQNKKHTLTCQGGTGCYRFNYQPGS